MTWYPQAGKAAEWRNPERRPSKYRAVRVEHGDHTHDSLKERERCHTLELRRERGEIVELIRQPRFPLIVNKQLIAHYIADFRYVELPSQRIVIEDVKSEPTKTPVYRLKKKLVKALYGLEIQEV